MQAGTHIAGAAFVAAIARGLGLEIGPMEAAAFAVSAILADMDTTTSGVGRFMRPLAAQIESRFGHRTLTHSLIFTAGLMLCLSPLLYRLPGVWWAFLWGYLSHLLLDTLNVNGVPLLWPAPLQFWMFSGRSLRIRYGSPAETTLALVLAVLALVVWPIGGDGFDTAFRRAIGTPETAVADYIDMQDTHEVYAELDGFNTITQEPMVGKYRIVEAIGKTGVLVEDDAGRVFQVSQFGQVVASSIKAYPAAKETTRTYRLDVGGRLLGDVVAALPGTANLTYITGTLSLSADQQPPPPPVGSFARVSRAPGREPVLDLHAARPQDLQPYSSVFISSGSLVVRSIFTPGKEVNALPLAGNRAQVSVRTVMLANLPTLAGLLVQTGDIVTEGQPLARYVDDVTPRTYRAQAGAERQTAARLRAAISTEETGYKAQQAALGVQQQEAARQVNTWKQLVAQDAATRLELEAKQAALSTVNAQVTALSVSHTSALAGLTNQEADARARAAQDERKATAAETKQLIRSPVAGKVGQVKPGPTTAQGISVEISLIVQDVQTLRPVSDSAEKGKP